MQGPTDIEALVAFMGELSQEPDKIVTHGELFNVIHLTIGAINEAMTAVADAVTQQP